MKTRDAIYSKEAADLLRTITTYKALTSAQIYRLFPGRETKTKAILVQLIRQGRVFYNEESDILAAAEEQAQNPDAGMIAAFWVLLDFLDRAEYHTSGDFPVQICYFADDEVVEIVHVATGQEALISHALASGEDPPRRLVIVDAPEQTADIHIPNTAGFCVVAPDGAVTYYKRQKNEE